MVFIYFHVPGRLLVTAITCSRAFSSKLKSLLFTEQAPLPSVDK